MRAAIRLTAIGASVALGAAGLLFLGGCGQRAPAAIVVEGTVTCGGEKVELGKICFHPLEGTSGPTSMAVIHDGRYCMDARGGVALGRHRVEIVAEKRTGRRVMGQTLTEPHMIDETVRMGPPSFAGPQSPLVIELTEQSDGRLDFDLPRQ